MPEWNALSISTFIFCMCLFLKHRVLLCDLFEMWSFVAFLLRMLFVILMVSWVGLLQVPRYHHLDIFLHPDYLNPCMKAAATTPRFSFDMDS